MRKNKNTTHKCLKLSEVLIVLQELFGEFEKEKNTLYRVNVYKLCNTSVRGFVRVRDEGKQVTATSKIYRDQHPEENEIKSGSDFEKTSAFLKSTGL